MKKLKYLSVLVLSLVVLSSCSSDNDSNPAEEEAEEEDVMPENLLCEGNGSGSYFPLAMGNYWKWEWPFNSGPSVSDITAEVIGTFDYMGNTYFELTYTGSNGQYHFKYLREDTQGNLKTLVYFIDSTGNYYEEHLVIPNSVLSTGDQWEFYSVFDSNDFVDPVQRVQSINAALETDFCNYTGGLEIFTRNLAADPAFPQSAILDYKIYKKGLGLINFEGNVLTEVILN